MLPAAGYGRRVGSPHAKELLPARDGKPLIQWGLEQALTRGWPVHVITRKEKTELISYLKQWRDQKGCELTIQEIEVHGEWPLSILEAEGYWRDENVLLLPDTRFHPVTVLDELASHLGQSDCVFGSFDTHQPQVWGCFRKENNGIEICEKPLETLVEKAWGLIGFKKHIARGLFDALAESSKQHQWQKLACRPSEVPLLSFEDLTR